MKVAGRGRIVIWEGASLWIMQVVPARESGATSTDFHAHHAIQVTMALEVICPLPSGPGTIILEPWREI